MQKIEAQLHRRKIELEDAEAENIQKQAELRQLQSAYEIKIRNLDQERHEIDLVKQNLKEEEMKQQELGQ